MQKDNLCFCRSDVMSICTATDESEQIGCKYYKKSSHSDRCMYFVFEEYCDCLEAQVAARKSIHSNNDPAIF